MRTVTPGEWIFGDPLSLAEIALRRLAREKRLADAEADVCCCDECRKRMDCGDRAVACENFLVYVVNGQRDPAAQRYFGGPRNHYLYRLAMNAQ